eukprot:TRINITY_DN9905_c0_g1_i1.p1 TRINITY_DN9905_c0_g1~~TRINITY_DN9905_c0_g1_i1.p1  ORF type:complete len:232 (-),score=31.92 TRINITY_DN9905_c0_g1_i1:590-1285(-)
MCIRDRVYRGSDRVGDGTHQSVAIKRVDPTVTGVANTTIREISMLQQLMHPAIVELRNIATDGDGTCLVLEYVDSDLEGLLGRLVARSWRLPSCGARHFCAQMLVGLQHLHDHGVLHRDIKPANLLISRVGVLKLADFGLARTIPSSRLMTNNVVTRWWRAPELLLGARAYGRGVDIWAAGCVLAQLIHPQHRPIFNGNHDDAHLHQVRPPPQSRSTGLCGADFQPVRSTE